MSGHTPAARGDLAGRVAAEAFRAEWGRLNAALIARTGDWDLAEECAQEAFAQALRRWPGDGVPDRPGAWLMRYLAALTGSPVVELNRAVAVAMADGPAAGLALLDRLAAAGALPGYYLLPATRADFLRRLGRRAEAAAYEDALALVGSEPERRFLDKRLAEVRPR